MIKAPLDYRIDFEWPTGLDNALQVQPLNSVLALRQDCCLLPATWGGGGGGGGGGNVRKPPSLNFL